MVEYEVTDLGIFKRNDTDRNRRSKKLVFDLSSTARITSTDDLGIMTGLEPIVIWRTAQQGENGGDVYLSPGAKPEDYGNLLQQYENVFNNPS